MLMLFSCLKQSYLQRRKTRSISESMNHVMNRSWHGCKTFMSNINLRTHAFETINVTVLITLHQRLHIEQPCINYIASIALKKPLIVRLFKHTELFSHFSLFHRFNSTFMNTHENMKNVKPFQKALAGLSTHFWIQNKHYYSVLECY